MNPIYIAVTGRLGAEPRTFTANGETGVELRLALDLPGREGREGPTRWVKAIAFGVLASRTAASVHTGDRVTVIATDLTQDVWIDKNSNPGDPRAKGQTVLRGVIEIAASLRFDTLSTGYADRKAARTAAANGEPSDLDGAEQADLQVLNGITTS